MINGPDFLCIGAQKAGTTWVYDNLEHHPEVWLPPSPFKELHYFDDKVPHKIFLEFGRFSHGGMIRRYSSLFTKPSWSLLRWLWRYNHHANDSMDWYRSLFTERGKKCGEITPEYTTLDERGVEYVKKVVGENCKVFIVLRDPVSRSWSALKMLYRYNNINISDTDAVSLISEMQSPYSTLKSDYVRIIETWKKYFSDETFKVFFFDDLVKDPDKLIKDICRYIGVDEAGWISLNLKKKSNSDRKKIIMPDQVKTQMYKFYMPELAQLSDLVGSHATSWLHNAEQVVNNNKLVANERVNR